MVFLTHPTLPPPPPPPPPPSSDSFLSINIKAF